MTIEKIDYNKIRLHTGKADLYHDAGSVVKFLKPSYNLEKRSEENHKCDILKEINSNKILFW